MASQELIPLGLRSLKGELKYDFSLPIETPSNNFIKQAHFRDYRLVRKQFRILIAREIADLNLEPPIERSFLVITRECAGGGLDWDNAYGGLKPLQDCLVKPSKRNPDGLGLIVDDNPQSMPYAPLLIQQSAKQQDGRTRVQIFQI